MTIDRRTMRWNGWGWRDHPDSLAGREEVWDWLAGELRMPALLLTPALPLEDAKVPPSQLSDQDRRVLTRIAGAEGMRDDPYERAFHAGGRGYRDLLARRAGDLSRAPDAVLYPTTNEQVLMLLAYASERDVAVVPYGGGTNSAGGLAANHAHHSGVIAIDLSSMDRVEQVDADSLAVRAQAGIAAPALEKALGPHGLTFGPLAQQSEFSTLGSWIAAGGEHSDTLCKPQDWLIAADVATPRGMLRDTGALAIGARVRLTDLMVGSMGAFGIVTSTAIRVQRASHAVSKGGWLFRNFEQGTAAVREAVQAGIPATMLSLLDAEGTRFHRSFAQLGGARAMRDRAFSALLHAGRYDEPCLLIAAFEGTPDLVRWASSAFRSIARGHSGFPLGRQAAEDWQEARLEWPYWRDSMLDRALGVETIRTAAAWSELAPLYVRLRLALETAIGQSAPRAGARGLILGHMAAAAPDGARLCFTAIFPRDLDREIAQSDAIKAAATKAILGSGGAAAQASSLGNETLRAIKRTLDPKGILNPGKLIP